MSAGNVEIVRRIYEAKPRRDGLEPILGLFDPDFENVSPLAASFTGADYRGHSGMRQWLEDMVDVWEELQAEPIGFTDAGDHVVVDVRWRARGRKSSVEVDRKITQVWTLRAGKAVRVETFTDRTLALEVAGLQK